MSDHAAGTDDLGALDLLPEAVLVLDADGVLRHANDRAQVLLVVPAAAIGKHVADVVDVLDDQGLRCGPEWVPTRGIAHRVAERVLQVRVNPGHVRPVAMAGRFTTDGATVLTFRSAGRRERVDAARSDLVATVSHEIRSPLTSVKGFTSTMLRKWDRFSDEHKRTMLEAIDHDADRVTRLLKELLAVSRIDAGRVQMHRELTDVVAALEGLIERARHREEGMGRDLVLQVDEAPPRAFVDPDKFEQVCSNLLDNALAYAPGSEVRVGVTHDGEELHVSVADDGPGIPEDQVRRIFDKFGQGQQRRRAGTGLGLYVTRGLATAHGGRVWCESEVGEGTVFHVVLPLEA